MKPTPTRLRVAAVAATALLALLAAGGQPAIAASNARLEFGAQPTAGTATDQGGSYFLLNAQPETQITQAVTLTNQTSTPMTIAAHVAVATTGPLGGISYSLDKPPTTSSTTAGWIKLRTTNVTLAPRASRSVSFTVSIPTNVTSGTHIAGISFERITQPPATRKSPTRDAAGASIVLHSRRVIAVQIITPGAPINSLQIDSVTASPRADAMYLMVHLRNDGNTLLKADGSVQLNTESPFTRRFHVDTFVPGTTIEYPIRWTTNPSQGRYPASIQLSVAGHTVNWSGTVQVGESAIRSFGDRSGKPTAAPRTPQPIIYLLAILCAIVATIGIIIRRRRTADWDTL